VAIINTLTVVRAISHLNDPEVLARLLALNLARAARQ